MAFEKKDITAKHKLRRPQTEAFGKIREHYEKKELKEVGLILPDLLPVD